MNRFRPCLAALALVLVLGAGAAHADTNLIRNGSFETGDFAAWQVRLGDPTTFVDFGPNGRAVGDATDGRFLAFFGSTQASGGSFISQAVTTLPGARYLLGFDLANDNAGAAAHNGFSVALDGRTLYAAVDLPGQDDARQVVAFDAAGATSTLTFGGYNDLGYVELDAVTLVPASAVAAVPEPSTWALLLAGAGLLPGFARRWVSRRS